MCTSPARLSLEPCKSHLHPYPGTRCTVKSTRLMRNQSTGLHKTFFHALLLAHQGRKQDVDQNAGKHYRRVLDH
eukprot:3106139-Amphidinium_carterae.1